MPGYKIDSATKYRPRLLGGGGLPPGCSSARSLVGSFGQMVAKAVAIVITPTAKCLKCVEMTRAMKRFGHSVDAKIDTKSKGAACRQRVFNDGFKQHFDKLWQSFFPID
jgi:hypothetical protein